MILTRIAEGLIEILVVDIKDEIDETGEVDVREEEMVERIPQGDL